MLHGRTTLSKFIIEEQRKLEGGAELIALVNDIQTACKYIAKRIMQPHFANARSIRNALDRARLRQASRIVGGTGRAVSRDDLSTITAADLRASRVFKA